MLSMNKVINKLFFYRKKILWRLIGKPKMGILRCLSGMMFFKTVPICFLDQVHSNTIEINKCGSDIDIFPPFFVGNNEYKPVSVSLPAVTLYMFDNVKVRGDSSNFVTSNVAIIERVPSVDVNYCRYDTGSVISHSATHAAVCSRKSQIEIDSAIFLGGNGSWNYYHWLLEILPKIKYFIDFGVLKNGVKILVPNEFEKYESFKSLLYLALSELACDIVVMPFRESVHVKKLYVVTTPTNIVFNTFGEPVKPFHYIFRPDVVDYLRRLVLSHLENNEKIKHRYDRIFLARSNSTARQYNQNEIIELFEKYDFNVIYPEKLTLWEQVSLFHHAKFIVGPSGAAWSNMVFCREGTKAISWLTDNVSGFSVFSTIAKYVGADIRFIVAAPIDCDNIHSSYSISCIELDSLISSMI